MIFVYPPATKISEPPAGIARLCGALRHHGVDARCVDMSAGGFHHILGQDMSSDDRWTSRAILRRETNISLLTGSKGYRNIDQYRNAVLDINRVLKKATAPTGTEVSLANYKSQTLSPVISSDLRHAADHPEENSYYAYFKSKFASLNAEHGGLTTIGMSLNYLNQALTAFAMMGHIKQAYPGVRIILGGGLVTSWMRMPGWENKFSDIADVMIAGEGEETILGLYGIRDTQRHYLPDYSDFKDERYLSPGFILPFSTSGGCYWKKCTFCPERAEKNPYTPICADIAVDQLRELTCRYQPELVHILDNSISPAFMRKLAASGFQTPWYAFARVTPHLADKDYCQKLKASGCRMLKLGIETGDPKVLSDMNKGVTHKLVSEALDALHHAGIKAYVYLLFGTPTETEISARKTMDFVVDHSEKIGFLNLSVFNLPYFAPEAASLDTKSFYDGDLSLYSDFTHPSGWHRGRIRRFLDKEFKKHPDIAPIVHGDPPVFNANHAAFF